MITSLSEKGLSVKLCESLCLCGGIAQEDAHHRGTEFTQRITETNSATDSSLEGEKTMSHRYYFCKMVLLWTIMLLPTIAYVQVTQAEYERAAVLLKQINVLTVNTLVPPTQSN